MRNEGFNGTRKNMIVGSLDSVSTISQNDTTLNETFSEEDTEEDEIVDLETISPE